MSKTNLWFTRRDKEIRGPFPAGMITRYILLGRILDTDELSPDQINWELVVDCPDLYPDLLNEDMADPDNRERLHIARMREDERIAGDRRDGDGEEPDDIEDLRRKRSGKERRLGESVEALKHRDVKTGFYQSVTEAQEKEKYYFRISLVAIFLVAVVIVSTVYAPKNNIAINNCNTEPAPYVNWSNCRLDGIQLAKKDLSSAQFRSSTLNGADLSEATLKNAEFSYANLTNANIRNADLKEAILVGATLRNANFTGANLTSANLSYSILHNAVLVNADLRNADLTHAVLNGARLDGVKLEGAILDKAIWVDNTVCAPGSVGKCIPLPKIK